MKLSLTCKGIAYFPYTVLTVHLYEITGLWQDTKGYTVGRSNQKATREWPVTLKVSQLSVILNRHTPSGSRERPTGPGSWWSCWRAETYRMSEALLSAVPYILSHSQPVKCTTKKMVLNNTNWKEKKKIKKK